MDGSGPNRVRRDHRIAVIDKPITVDTTILRTRVLPCRPDGRIIHLFSDMEDVTLQKGNYLLHFLLAHMNAGIVLLIIPYALLYIQLCIHIIHLHITQ